MRNGRKEWNGDREWKGNGKESIDKTVRNEYFMCIYTLKRSGGA